MRALQNYWLFFTASAQWSRTIGVTDVRNLCQNSNLGRRCRTYLCSKKRMKKKKIIFSTSGGTPAMRFLTYIIDHFGDEEIEHIAAQIAAMCRKAELTIRAVLEDGLTALHGNTAKSIVIDAGTMELTGENLSVVNKTIIIAQ